MSQSLANLTLGGKTGPAQTMTAIPLANISRLDLDFAASRGTVYQSANAAGQPRRIEFDLILTTTLTDTITALVNVIAIAGS
jgi:hypothetical protein